MKKIIVSLLMVVAGMFMKAVNSVAQALSGISQFAYDTGAGNLGNPNFGGNGEQEDEPKSENVKRGGVLSFFRTKGGQKGGGMRSDRFTNSTSNQYFGKEDGENEENENDENQGDGNSQDN